MEIRKSGTPDAPITIAGETGAKIYGSDENIAEKGTWRPLRVTHSRLGGQAAWSPTATRPYGRKEGGALYSIQAPMKTAFVAMDDERLYHFASLEELQTETHTYGGEKFHIPGGWYQDRNNKVYIILPDHSDPAKHKIHIGIRDSVIFLDSVEHIIVKDLEVAYANTGCIYLRNSSNNWVHHNRVHSFRKRGIFVRRLPGDDNLIEYNEVSDRPVASWPWRCSKSHDCEDSAISIRSGRGNVVRYNKVYSLFNGIDPASFVGDERMSRDCDIHNNLVYDISDDAFEPDGHGVNQRFWHNYMKDVFMGFSVSPIDVGPTYIVRNVIFNNSHWGFKAHNKTSGYLFIYHTSIYTERPDTRAFNSDPACGYVTSRNNIYYATFHYNLVEKQPILGPNDFDYDAFWSPKGTFGAWWDTKKHLSFKPFVQGSGMERHGIVANPMYVNPQAGDLSLRPESPLKDKGAIIPGINDDKFLGRAPDIGAYEIGQPPWQVIPD